MFAWAEGQYITKEGRLKKYCGRGWQYKTIERSQRTKENSTKIFVDRSQVQINNQMLKKQNNYESNMEMEKNNENAVWIYNMIKELE